MKDFKQTMTEAQGWPMDKLVDYIMENYHEGCVMRVDSMRREAEMLKNQEGAVEAAKITSRWKDWHRNWYFSFVFRSFLLKIR